MGTHPFLTIIITSHFHTSSNQFLERYFGTGHLIVFVKNKKLNLYQDNGREKSRHIWALSLRSHSIAIGFNLDYRGLRGPSVDKQSM